MGDTTGQTHTTGAPPVSSFQDSIHDLLQCRLLQPPVCPGLLASLDGYEILRVIGLGGMGLVLLARESGRPETVAIKLIRPELAGDARAVQRFLAEARHMRQFSHAGIVRVLAISDSPKRPYFVMPFLAGGNLADLLEPGHPLIEPVILRIARRVAEALACAHGKGIIHRDLKPANVLLDEQGEACLTDFGLARDVFNESVTDVHREHREGTAAYMSPAVATGKAEDTRCDIYGFGAVLYEMLTGRPPYQGKTSKEILEEVQTGPPTPIRSVNPSAPPGLVTVAEGAMARELRDRYSEMADVAHDLERVSSGQKPFGPRGVGGHRDLAQGQPTHGKKALRVAGLAVLALAATVVAWRANHWSEAVTHPSLPKGAAGISAVGSNAPPIAGEGLEVTRRIELAGIWHWGDARVGRWEGEPEPLLFLPHANRLLVFSASGTLLHQSVPIEPRSEDFRLRLVSALDDDKSDDAVVSWRSGRQVCLSVLNHHFAELKRFTLEGCWEDSSTGEKGLSEIETDWIGDLDGDGQRELLAQIGTPWTNAIRGLYCFDFEKAELRWSHLTGPYVHEATPVDLDGDGRQEILLGSYAVANGHSADDGTDDSHSYLYAFASDGRLRWATELGGPLTYVHPLKIDGGDDGRGDVLAWLDGAHDLWSKIGQTEIGAIFRLDSEGGRTREIDLGARLYSCRTVDINGDGRQELLATDRQGYLHVLDLDLKPLARRQLVMPRFGDVELRIGAVADWDGDGHPEVVLTSFQREFVAGLTTGTPTDPPSVRRPHERQLLVLNTQLAVVASLRLGDAGVNDPTTWIEVLDLDGDGRKEILWLGPEALVIKTTK